MELHPGTITGDLWPLVNLIILKYATLETDLMQPEYQLPSLIAEKRVMIVSCDTVIMHGFVFRLALMMISYKHNNYWCINSPLLQNLNDASSIWRKIYSIFTRNYVILCRDNSFILHFFTVFHLKFHPCTFSGNFRYTLHRLIVNTPSKMFGSISSLIFSLSW